MMTTAEHITGLLADLRLQAVDLNRLYTGRKSLTPLESVELFLQEELRLKTEKQNRLRRKNARLPYEKTIEGFDFGFQRSVSKEQLLQLSDMTWVDQAYNICFLGPPGVGKTHLAVSLAACGLDKGYTVAFETLEDLIKIKKLCTLWRKTVYFT